MKELRQKARNATSGPLQIAAILLAASCILPPAARAIEPRTPLTSLNRQSWAMENGLPQNTIQALAQTNDGFLWLGTEAGLVRFDGMSFAIFDRGTGFTPGGPALPDNDVRCLLAAPDGALWIGTAAGLARLNRGTLTVFTTKNGLPGNEILGLYPEQNGAVTVETDSGFASIENNHVAQIDVAALRATRAGTLSARLPDGRIAAANKGTLSILHNSRVETTLAAGTQLPGKRIQALLADREGAVWVGTNKGLARIVGGRAERLPMTDPLAAVSVLSLLEDREGNLWVGTETEGLHVLRDQRFLNIGAREGLSSDATTAVTEDESGKLWVGTNGAGLNALRLSGGRPGEAPSYALPDVLLSRVILSLAVGRNDSLWVGTNAGLNRVRGGAVDAFTTINGLPDNAVQSLLADKDGSVWIGTRRGLAHWSFEPDGRTVARRQTYTEANGLGGNLIGAMARDAHGDMWIATSAGLGRLHAGKITNYTTADGLSSNAITALLARHDGTLLIGTADHGWNLWDGRTFRPVTGGNTQHAPVPAILDDRLGHVWLATGTGIARCDASGLDASKSDANKPDPNKSGPPSCPNWVEFNASDGLRSRSMAANGLPAGWHSADGRLWFATPKGLAALDPAHFPMNSVPPPVAIERFAVDDAELPLHGSGSESGSTLSLAAGHVHFQFDYAAMSFVAPQKVRYRYILEGVDRAWTDAGARRTAYYTNIPPGKYTFRVQAANNDGVWNTAGAALRFELKPRFYQTLWFYVLLGAAAILLVLALVFLALRLRLRRAERQFRAVLEERNRIAREIHDTLAQGYVGVSVQLEVLSELLRRNRLEAAAKQLDAARESVRAGLADARQSIWALRSQSSEETTLPVRLRRIVEQADGSNGPENNLDATFAVYGAYRALAPETEREILRIAQEAIHNGKSHAQARHLWTRLEYTPGEVALEVRDDGRGFQPASASGRIESPPGHFGLTGMRERAEEIGAALAIESEPGAGARTGTVVRLTVPAPQVPTQQGTEEKA